MSSSAPSAFAGGTPRDPAVPRHVAIVMDGNGRWAKRRFLPRVVGHKYGVDSLVRTINACAERGVDHLTVFAFSSENWNRPAEEVSGLMNLVLVAVSRYLGRMAEDGVRIRIIGDRTHVAQKVRDAWDEAERLTAHNRRITVSVAFNYGGRWDIVQATRKLIGSGVAADDITEAMLASHLSMAYAPDPDLFIRTGGEVRISNFLLWQSAYTEFYFTDCLWPDFDERVLDEALADYARRDRRYGRVKPDVVATGDADVPAPAESA
ncbi:MAG: polyprenyl diphosphate synthase [Leptothrix sp. (in: b-proteobacteria)]